MEGKGREGRRNVFAIERCIWGLLMIELGVVYQRELKCFLLGWN